MAKVVSLSDEQKKRAARRSAKVRVARDLDASYVRWLWYPRVPLGKLTLVSGLPDEAKSLVCVDLAARASAGMPMPLQAMARIPPVGAWIHSAEDDPCDTIRPRLEAAGADLSRVLVTTEGSIELPDDIDAIEELVIAHEVRLIVIDPLESIISGELDAHSSKDVRSALDPLVALAIRRKVAIVGVRHLNKDVRTTNARVRGTGSLAYTAIARSEILCGQHPEDDTLRVFARVKNNIAVAYPSITYGIALVESAIKLMGGPDAAFDPPGDRIVVPRIAWGESCEVKAGEILRGQAQEGKAGKDGDDGRRVGPKTGEAEELIKAMLFEVGGARDAGEIIARAADDGITERTVKRAAMNLIQCGMMTRTKKIDVPGVGGGGAWEWRLLAGPDEL